MKRSVILLGSTGSVGRNAVSLLKDFEVVALTAKNNVDLLIEQAKVLNPKRVVIANEAHYLKLKDCLSPHIEVCAGFDAVIEAASMPCDLVISAIVGIFGLVPTLKALESGRIVGLANKESLVVAGSLVMETAKRFGSTIIPVDSEHSGIFQVIEEKGVKSIIITGSGGPFFRNDKPKTKDNALRHPNWSMGQKISIDSATWMNKGFEVIEAHHLFHIPYSKIHVCIHPESIIHGLVSFEDGTILAHLGDHDMKIPLAYALSWPHRMKTDAKQLNLSTLSKLTFFDPDDIQFPCLRLAKEAALANKTILLNAANDVCVECFLNEHIKFSSISKTIDYMLNHYDQTIPSSVEEVLQIDLEFKRLTNEAIKKIP